METGNWSEEGAAGGSSSAFSWLDELAEEAWLNKEAEEDVGVHGDGFVSENWPFPAAEAARPFPRLPSTAFAGQRSRRRQPRFQPTLSVVRDLSPAPPPPTPSCAPPPPPTTSVVGQAEESLDRLGPVDKGKGKAVDEEQPAGRPTFQQTVAAAPTSSPSQAPPIPRLPSPLPSFVRRMLETSAPPRLADRPLHPDLLRERVPVATASPREFTSYLSVLWGFITDFLRSNFGHDSACAANQATHPTAPAIRPLSFANQESLNHTNGADREASHTSASRSARAQESLESLASSLTDQGSKAHEGNELRKFEIPKVENQSSRAVEFLLCSSGS